MADGHFFQSGIRTKLALRSADGLTAVLVKKATVRGDREPSRLGRSRMIKAIRDRAGSRRVPPVRQNSGPQRVDCGQVRRADDSAFLAGTRRTVQIRYEKEQPMELNVSAEGGRVRSPFPLLALLEASTDDNGSTTCFDGGQDGN